MQSKSISPYSSGPVPFWIRSFFRLLNGAPDHHQRGCTVNKNGQVLSISVLAEADVKVTELGVLVLMGRLRVRCYAISAVNIEPALEPFIFSDSIA